MVGRRSKPDALSYARQLSLAGLLGALALLLPIGFHALGWGGRILLPMHLPIVIAGFLLEPGLALSLGLIVPLLSAVLTGMPPLAPPMALLMSVELAVKAGSASVLYRRLHAPMWTALPMAIAADWAVLAAAALQAAKFFVIQSSPVKYVVAAIVLSLPGTVLQLVAVPAVVLTIERRIPSLRRKKGEPA
jgi:hypothetical protein